MVKFSRREFICFSASFSLFFPIRVHALTGENNSPATFYPNTILAIKQAFKSEIIAHKHYLGYVKKALAENYPNIAYMFQAFSFSEKIHADNYKRIVSELGSEINRIIVPIDVRDTKSNLQKAAEKELKKIKKFYPELLKKIKSESYDDAILNCMYSWKSHRQHEKKVKEIQRYSGFFFGSMASKIEKMNFDFHICKICGSTIDCMPTSPCEICNRSMSHYKKVIRPV